MKISLVKNELSSDFGRRNSFDQVSVRSIDINKEIRVAKLNQNKQERI
jgi:hypothetical protein